MLAVIITTLNEANNIKTLIPAIDTVLKEDYITVVVDDNSLDGTQEIVIGLSKDYPINLICRPKKMGIASAIMDGIKQQKAEYYVTMEGDWSHPPSLLNPMRYFLKKYDLVVASRYADKILGDTENWPLSRRVISLGANMLARPLTKISDATTGMIGIQSHCLEGIKLNPIGMHFPLECFVKAEYDTYMEIPYTFRGRSEGKSSFNCKEVWNYLSHLSRLYKYKVTHNG
jgi:dolichol-phosphate mannosyltransferase